MILKAFYAIFQGIVWIVSLIILIGLWIELTQNSENVIASEFLALNIAFIIWTNQKINNNQ